MKNFIWYFFLLILNYSCAPYEPSGEEKQEVFNNVPYNKKILADFFNYDSLAQFLLTWTAGMMSLY